MAAMTHREAVAIASRSQNRDARHRMQVKHFEAALVRKAAVSMAAGAYGVAQRSGVKNDIKGFPWKMGVWLGATLVEALSKGMVQSFAAGVSDATMAIYMENAISTKTFVAGDAVSGEGGEI